MHSETRMPPSNLLFLGPFQGPKPDAPRALQYDVRVSSVVLV